MSFLFAPVTGDVRFAGSWDLHLVVDVGECDTICAGCLPSVTFLLPIGEQVVCLGDCLWVFVLALEIIVLEILNESSVSCAITPQHEGHSGGAFGRLLRKLLPLIIRHVFDVDVTF